MSDIRKKDPAPVRAPAPEGKREKTDPPPSQFASQILKILSASNPGYSTISSTSAEYASLGDVFRASSARAFLEQDNQKVRALEDQIRKLRDDVTAKSNALEQKESTIEEQRRRTDELSSTFNELTKKLQLHFLLGHVGLEARAVLLEVDSKLSAEFLKTESRKLFAMSVDIRRSTELMLKARSPQDFATFITELCTLLMQVVFDHHGVVDKFTGDGILCYFPEFFSGEDAGFYAISAADACHRVFEGHYRARRNSFQSVLRDVGLGIGIDYGECHLVQVADSLTIVGAPVVYACRLGGAPAGTTLLNQPAYQIISQKHGGAVFLNETSIEIKHEGRLVAYSASLSRSNYPATGPAWKMFQQSSPPPKEVATQPVQTSTKQADTKEP